MKEVIKDLKSIIRRYTTYLELNKSGYMITNDELNTIRKAIRYLELLFDLANQYKGDNNDK